MRTAAALLLLASVQTAQIIDLKAESRLAEAEAVSLELGTASAFGRVRQGYVGITLSFLYDDPGWENTSILTINLDDRFSIRATHHDVAASPRHLARRVISESQVDLARVPGHHVQ